MTAATIHLPKVGASVTLPVGTLTRVGETRYQVARGTLRPWESTSKNRNAVVGFIYAVNYLRRMHGMTEFPLPCAHCGVNQRMSGTNVYCARSCYLKAKGRAPSDPFRPNPGPPSTPKPYDFARFIAALGECPPRHSLTVEPIVVEDTGAHGFSNAIAIADALIARRRTYAVLDDALARAQRRRVLRTEKAS